MTHLLFWIIILIWIGIGLVLFFGVREIIRLTTKGNSMTDEIKPDLGKHLAQQEATRHATGASLDTMLARISAEATAEAAAKRAADHAASFRRDLANFPRDVVLTAARKHLDELVALPLNTPDRQQSIDDMKAFLSKL